MKKLVWTVLAVLMVGVMPTQFVDTAGNLKPIATLNETTSEKGEQQ